MLASNFWGGLCDVIFIAGIVVVLVIRATKND